MTSEPRQIDCNEVAERLYEYLDGELTPERDAEVRRHLDQCVACFGLWKFEDGYVRFLEARSRARGVPEPLRRKIMDEILFGKEGGPGTATT